MRTNAKGFTLIELLIVIGILAVLASVVVIVLNPAQLLKKSRDAQRVEDLTTIQKALSLYQVDNGTYPTTSGLWCGEANVGAFSANCPSGDWIPGLLASGYIAKLPQDPNPPAGRGYIYISNGLNYKFMAWTSVEDCANSAYVKFIDPLRTCAQKSWSIYTPGYSGM